MNLKKILVVEDSELHQKLYDAILLLYKKRGVDLIRAFNGKEALEKLYAYADINLIILDINMPVMSGLEFLQKIKNEQALKLIPVIICSTEGKDEDIMLGLRMGADAYIKKPFKPEELHQIIEKIIKTLPSLS
jgi:CheY-like chemotaxis protein